MNKFTEDTLYSFLNSHNVDTSEWGTGVFKSVNRLLGEIKKGEIELNETKNGKIERIVHSCSADIYYKDKKGILWKLKEEKRVMVSGGTRFLTHKESVRGKIKAGESSEETIQREIKEELGIPSIGYEIKFLHVGEHEGVSTNYPNLFSRFTQHYFEAFLKEEYFNPDGYIEIQPDYSIFFVWQKAN